MPRLIQKTTIKTPNEKLEELAKEYIEAKKNATAGEPKKISGTPRTGDHWNNVINEYPLTKMKCFIPESILNLMRGLDDHFNSQNIEFSIFCKSYIDKDRDLIISDEYYIPEQICTSTEVEYKEDNLEYNTVIHKHPNNVKSFSGTDEEYINRNFLASLLWVDKKFELGLVNIPTSIGLLRLPLELNLMTSPLELPEQEVLDKIKKKTYAVSQHYNYNKPITGSYNSYNPNPNIYPGYNQYFRPGATNTNRDYVVPYKGMAENYFPEIFKEDDKSVSGDTGLPDDLDFIM